MAEGANHTTTPSGRKNYGQFLQRLYALLDSDDRKTLATIGWDQDGTSILVLDVRDSQGVLDAAFGGSSGLKRLSSSLFGYGFKKTSDVHGQTWTHPFLNRYYSRHELSSVTRAAAAAAIESSDSYDDAGAYEDAEPLTDSWIKLRSDAWRPAKKARAISPSRALVAAENSDAESDAEIGPAVRRRRPRNQFLPSLYRMLSSDDPNTQKTIRWDDLGTSIILLDEAGIESAVRAEFGEFSAKLFYNSLTNYGFKKGSTVDLSSQAAMSLTTWKHAALDRKYPSDRLPLVGRTAASKDPKLVLDIKTKPLAKLSIAPTRSIRRKFLVDLYSILDSSDAATNAAIRWNDAGDAIFILDQTATDKVLRKVFEQNSRPMHAFRQSLHGYGFKRVSQKLEGALVQTWTHPELTRSFPRDKLGWVGRVDSANSSKRARKSFTTKRADAHLDEEGDADVEIESTRRKLCTAADEFVFKVMRAVEDPSNSEVIRWDNTGRTILIVNVARSGSILGAGYTAEFKKRGFELTAARHAGKLVPGWRHSKVERGDAVRVLGAPSMHCRALARARIKIEIISNQHQMATSLTFVPSTIYLVDTDGSREDGHSKHAEQISR
ncbi:hypothetical protein MKEN_00984500 [Mycena kentingensis (nom. inval.)]|nr:hypothetical protein MKEN_00984500 [Mycena kentingensis (nom. inval.)]